jgi:hypothetical protein
LQAAMLTMMETRKALDDYNTLKGNAQSPELRKLERAFAKATEQVLRLLGRRR